MLRGSIAVLGLAFVLIGCRSRPAPAQPVALYISFQVNGETYTKTRFRKPPQLAVWLESADGRTIRTVHVSRKTGAGEWGNKPDCPISLPTWVARYNLESGTKGDPTTAQPAPDAVTHPTIVADAVFRTTVPAGSEWHCYVEVNASGDFNEAFPARTREGREDIAGNGQPSLVYHSVVKAENGAEARFELLGRSDQWRATAEPIRDLQGMTSARQLLEGLNLKCFSADAASARQAR